MLSARNCSHDGCRFGNGGFSTLLLPPAFNILMLAAFTALIPVNLHTGLRYKTPSGASLIILGLLVEAIGHAGAVLLPLNAASHDLFSLYTIGTLWGATLIGSANYLALPRVMLVYGKDFTVVSRPVYFTAVFVFLDALGLAFQSAGISILSHRDAESELLQGTRVLIAGLAFQVTSVAAFLATYWYFRVKLSSRHHVLDPRYSAVYLTPRFNFWLPCMQAVEILFLIRAIIRAGNLSMGLTVDLVGAHVAIFALDDTLVLLACIIMTVVPVGRAFGSAWQDTSPFSASCGPTQLPLTRRQDRGQRHHSPSILHPRHMNTVSAQSSLRQLRTEFSPPPVHGQSSRLLPGGYTRQAYSVRPQAPRGILLNTRTTPEEVVKPKRPWPLGNSRLVNRESLWG